VEMFYLGVVILGNRQLVTVGETPVTEK
jgi:hypothetical protein